MATKYVVLQVEHEADEVQNGAYIFADEVEAPNAQTACRRVAENTPDDILAEGVTLIAVPARNWNSGRHTFRAETQRKLLRS